MVHLDSATWRRVGMQGCFAPDTDDLEWYKGNTLIQHITLFYNHLALNHKLKWLNDMTYPALSLFLSLSLSSSVMHSRTHWIKLKLGLGQVDNSTMWTYTRQTSHWVEGRLTIALCGHTHLQTSHWVEGKLTIALCGHTLDKHHTGLRAGWNSSMSIYTASTSHWVCGKVDNSFMCTHTGPTTHCSGVISIWKLGWSKAMAMLVTQ